jgi:hypothetical protein
MLSQLEVKVVDVRKLLTDMGCSASLDLNSRHQHQVDIDQRKELREAYFIQLARDDEVRRAQRATATSSSPPSSSPPVLPPPLSSSSSTNSTVSSLDNS